MVTLFTSTIIMCMRWVATTIQLNYISEKKHNLIESEESTESVSWTTKFKRVG